MSKYEVRIKPVFCYFFTVIYSSLGGSGLHLFCITELSPHHITFRKRNDRHSITSTNDTAVVALWKPLIFQYNKNTRMYISFYTKVQKDGKCILLHVPTLKVWGKEVRNHIKSLKAKK